jgi:predicted AAA+ superfamily ATPase
MRSISKEQVIERIRSDNPWWQSPHQIDTRFREMKPRAYFELFLDLVMQKSPRRAIILMGPRRVGKTVMIYQAIQQLIASGTPPFLLSYINIEVPLYNGLGIEELVKLVYEASGAPANEAAYFFFDEIQYLREWEIHLKTAVDSIPQVKFTASGSAAAALRLKSTESGAGRFTDFMLPPLTFYEYLDLLNLTSLVTLIDENDNSHDRFATPNIEELNKRFIHYLNFGGYPEVLFSPEIQADPPRYIRSDIIDKVLLRDLPSLYGIEDIQELNSLFTTLAYNTGNEVSLEALSQGSGVAKNTIKRYIEYLEAAFLIKIVHRIDRCGKKFKRAVTFKVYLTNPSMRSALFSPLGPDDDDIGNLVETAVFAQWFHNPGFHLYYARWHDGEVDIVQLDGSANPLWAVEVKWSDRFEEDPKSLKSLLEFCGDHKHCSQPLVTTRTKSSEQIVDHLRIEFLPASLYCITLGYNLIKGRFHAHSTAKSRPPRRLPK